MNWIKTCVKPGMVVVDVGANAGAFTHCFLERGATVIAVEPHRVEAQSLRDRYPAERFALRVIEAAMTDFTGEVRFHYSKASPHGSIFKLNLLEDLDQSEIVPAITLDSLGPVDVVKIDAQGAEDRILCGARETLARRHAIFYVELWRAGLENAGASVAVVRDRFQPYGYVPHGQTWDEVVKKANALGGHGSSDVLIVPQEWTA